MAPPSEAMLLSLGCSRMDITLLSVIFLEGGYNTYYHNLLLGKTFSQLRDFQKGLKH